MKRSDIIVAELKSRIVEKDLKPGDRLPQEKDLIDEFCASKATIRESLKTLEIQGLVTTKTGPGGGAFVTQTSVEKTMSLLSTYFYSNPLSISDIYQIRKILEPEMGASLVGGLSTAELERLRQTTTIYSSHTETAEDEFQQRLDEFSFHEVMADLCPNPLLSFNCLFMISLLKNLTICKQIYDHPNPELFEAGKYYQMALYEALKKETKKKFAGFCLNIWLSQKKSCLIARLKSQGIF